MITADGRSVVEIEIEQMQFTGLDTRKPVFGLDYTDVTQRDEETSEEDQPSFFTRLLQRLIGRTQPAL